MKRATKIGLVLFIVITSGIVISVGLNRWLTTIVRKQLDENIAQNDSLKFSYGEIELHVLSGEVWIKDVYFCSDNMGWSDSIRPVTEAKVDLISLDGINYYDWLVNRKLHLNDLRIVRPMFRMQFKREEEEETGDDLKRLKEEERRKRLEKILEVARILVDDAIIDQLIIDHAHVEARSINDSLSVQISECTFQIYDIGYNIKDEIPHYNDSVFHFLIRDINVHIPKVSMTMSVDELKAEPSGVLQISNVHISSNLNKEKTETVVAGVQSINFGGFDVAKFNAIKKMDVKNMHLYNPFVTLQIDESGQPDKKEKITKEQTQDKIATLNQKIVDSNLGVVEEYITELMIDTISIHDAMVNVNSTSTHFQLNGNQLSTSVYGLGYSLIDEIPYHYNDSVFQFHLGHLDVITPDSTIALSTNNVRYNNGGSFAIGKTHIYNIVDRWKLAHLHGDIPTTWMDIYVDTIYTSNKNIVKEAHTLGESFHLDTLYTQVDKISIFRDNRNKTQKPYTLPQKHLLKVKYPFIVNCINASIRDIYIETALTKQNVGKMNLGPIQLKIRNVTPIPNSTISAKADGNMGGGTIHAKFDMKVNRACNWNIKLDASNIDTHHLDSMIYPLVGLTIGCDIHHLTAEYGGDSQLAKGTICMEFDNLDIFADKNSNSPFTIVTDLSGLINSANKTIIHKSNPAKPGKKPVSYHIQWGNDPWTNPSIFYIGPLINGCIENFLPGLFLNKRVKNKKKIEL